MVPEKMIGLRTHFVSKVGASNKNSAAITSAGELFMWGSNSEGQLGYNSGSAESASFNFTPRRIDIQRKTIDEIALSKKHTVATSTDGDVYSWGYNSPVKRVVVRKSSNTMGKVGGNEFFPCYVCSFLLFFSDQDSECSNNIKMGPFSFWGSRTQLYASRRKGLLLGLIIVLQYQKKTNCSYGSPASTARLSRSKLCTRKYGT